MRSKNDMDGLREQLREHMSNDERIMTEIRHVLEAMKNNHLHHVQLSMESLQADVRSIASDVRSVTDDVSIIKGDHHWMKWAMTVGGAAIITQVVIKLFE